MCYQDIEWKQNCDGRNENLVELYMVSISSLDIEWKWNSDICQGP